jgi:diguanylate cyclase (GGDEF)-like protein/PAS domain S-box-containing protein
MEESVLWVVRDITERKEMEETLKESRERFRSLVQNAPDAIILVDADNTILYESPATGRILGYGAEERVGTRGLDYVHPDDVERAERTFALTLDSSRVAVPIEYRLRHKDGSWRHVEATRTNLLDDPAVRGVVINYRDVTERKRAEVALKESEERYRRQARELALLHQVRTALAQELEPPIVFRKVVEAVARTYGYTQVSAYLLEGEELVLQHQVGYEQVLDRIPVTRGIMGRVIRTRRPVLLRDVRSDPAFLDAIEGLTSEVCVPLYDEGEVVGTLNVESTNDVKLTEDDLRLMEAVAEHVGIAIGQARLYDRVRESEEKFRALIQNSSDLITLYDREGVIRYVSPALERILGYEPEERIGSTSFGLIHPKDVARAKELFAEALRRPGIPIPAEVRARHRDGSWRYIEAVGTNMLDHPSVGAVVLNGRDVTQRKEAEARLREAEKRYRTLVERIPAITYIQEPEEPSRTTYISPQYEEILGYSVEECLGDPEHWTKILHPDDRERVAAEDRRTNATGEPFGMEYRQFAKDGSVVWIRDEAAAVRDEEGRVRYWIGVQIDITERKLLEERLEYQAFHDTLTGLPNRALFMDRLERALSRTKRKKGQVAVLFLDVDNLKVVNDTLGHEAGDRLLTEVTGLLKTCLRPADTVARLSGDEFAILLEDVEGKSGATRVAERVAEALRAPLAIKGRETFITASIGIALSGPARVSAQEQAETLLRQADLAMYRAKSRGKAHHEVFDPGMDVSAFERLEMGNDLRRALERDEFRVYYQPKMQLDITLQQRLRFSGGTAIVAASGVTKKPGIVGMEALVRWEHPERGLLAPKEFIPVAEESGLIVPIGRKVLEEACRQARAWQELYPGEGPLVMCVNISARQFQHPELAQDIAQVLHQAELEPYLLQLEITENVLMEDVHATVDTLRKLEGLGVQFAIDDFGTGYSSLSYLKRFPVGFLKIDRSFVEPLGKDPEDAVIVSGIISLAHTLGMQVVAEGVETAQQLAYLQGLGCDMAQGDYFSEPLPSEAASALLARYLYTNLRADG